MTTQSLGKTFWLQKRILNETGKQVPRNGVGFRQWGEQNRKIVICIYVGNAHLALLYNQAVSIGRNIAEHPKYYQ
jgi:hypothetical protein